MTKSVVEEAISIYRAQIGAVEPYPDRVEDREAVVAAWVEACNGRGIRIEFDQDIMKLVGTIVFFIFVAGSAIPRLRREPPKPEGS